MKCYICEKEITYEAKLCGEYHSFTCTMLNEDKCLYVHKSHCYDVFCGKRVKEIKKKAEKVKMKFNPEQRVVIDKEYLSYSQNRIASSLNPPYVVTIKYIEPDPHSGLDMYRFEEISDGWYESEVIGLYVKKKTPTIFDIIDI